MLFENSPDAVFLTVPDGRILSANSAACAMFGMSQEEIIRVGRQGLVAPDDTRHAALLDERRRTGRVTGVELEHVRKNGERFSAEVDSVILPGEPQQSFVILRDITERKRSEEALRESEKKYKRLVETTGTGYVILDDQGRVADANLEYVRMTCHQRLEEILGHSMLEWTAPHDLESNRRAMKICLAQGFIRNLEIGYIMTGGKVKPIEINATVIRAEGRIQILTLCRDITQRKQAEDALTQSEQWFRSVVEHTRDALLIDDAAGRVLFVNERFLDLVGVSREEFSNLRMEDYIAPEFLQKLRDRHEARVRGDAQPTHFEYQGLRRDGKRLWLEVDVAVIRDEKGEITNTQSTIRDITHRKQAEEALRYQAKLLDNVFDGVVSTDASLLIKTWNKGAQRIYGWTAEEAIGQQVDELFHTEFAGISKEEAYRQLTEKGFSESEVVHQDRHGRKVVIQANVTLLKDEQGDFVGTLGVLRDITERKRAEKALRQSEERLRLAIEAGGLAYWEIDLATGEVIPSKRLREMFGLPPMPDPEFREHWRPRFHEEDSQRVRKAVDDAALGVPCRIQYRIRMPDGAVRWQQCEAMPIPDSAGKFTRLIGMVADISDHKQAEEALRKAKDELEQRVAERTSELSKSREKLSTLFRTSPAGIFLSRLEDGLLLEVNDTCQRTLGYSAQEMIGRTTSDLGIFVNSDDRKQAIEALKRDGRNQNVEMQYRHKSGRIVHLLINALPVDMDGVPCILGTILDITERKQAEDSLHRSEEMLNLIFRHSSDGINVVEFDPETYRRRLVLCNDRYVEMSGYTREHLLAAENLTPLARLHGGNEEKSDYYRKTLQGVPFAGRASWVRPDGKENCYEWLACSTRVNGKILIVGVDRDVTERQRAEEALKEANQGLKRSASRLRALSLELTRVEQRERRRIAELLHDHLQQLLVAAKLNIAALSQDELAEKQRDSASRAIVALDQAIVQSKSLSVELNPPILREGGLAHALQWLGRSMGQTHGMAVEVEAQIAGGRIDQEFRIVLFNAVRELLLNVLKHASVKSAKVQMSMLPGHQVRIVVSDRGSGFSRKVSGSANEVESGLGLLAIRERLESLGGVMEIESRPGQGSRIMLTAPLRPLVEPAKASPVRRPKVRADRTAGRKTAGDTAQKGIRVLLVDDHAIVRQGVAQLLSGVSEITAVAEASTGKEAIQLARKWRPDVVVMDVNMPEMSGVEATRIIHAKWPEVMVVGLSMYHEPHRAEEMRQAGAVGYVNKSEVTETLVATIRACCKK